MHPTILLPEDAKASAKCAPEPVDFSVVPGVRPPEFTMEYSTSSLMLFLDNP
jgi:hypothetical protein